jgi:hypothetical protein
MSKLVPVRWLAAASFFSVPPPGLIQEVELENLNATNQPTFP